jgi:hypothetical protein
MLKQAHLIELDVRKALVVSVLRIIEELRLHNLVLKSTIANSSLKPVFSNASGG